MGSILPPPPVDFTLRSDPNTGGCPRSRTAFLISANRKSPLERGRDRQAEGLAWFAEEVLRAIGLDGFLPRCSRLRRPAGTGRA